MKNCRFKIPSIIIAIGLVVSLVACLLSCMIRVPTITQQDFNYAVTYKLDGETKTIEGVYTIQFESEGMELYPTERYYQGFYASAPDSGEPDAHVIATKDDLVLRIVLTFADAYLMGDGEDDYNEEPYLAVYDKESYEYHDLSMLDNFDAELISWEMPTPIENTFVFAGFSLLYAGSMLAMLAVGILVIIACLIFVKKEADLSYKPLDKLSIFANLFVGLMATPFITLVVALMPLTINGDELIYQIFLCLPVFIAFTIAASIALRRKGFTKTGFFIQLIGPAVFSLCVFLESIVPNVFS